MPDQNYSAPVAQLLSLGEPDLEDWLNYESLGLQAEHIPELIRLVDDHALRWESPEDDPVIYAAVHAWRALGQLKAEAAAPALVGLLEGVDTQWDEAASEELPEVFGRLGPACIPSLAEYLAKPYQENFWGAVTAAEALVKIGELYPETKPECIQAISQQLEYYLENDATLNGFTISHLATLKASQAGALVERAFAAGKVDEGVMGDWEDYQVEVGLLAQRTTPKAKSELPLLSSWGQPALGRSVHKEDKKTKNKRKQEKQSRKKNRKEKEMTATPASSTIVQRLWNYCNVLRDDGMSYGDYLEQLTYLLFLKMDDENEHQLGKPSAIPADYNWASLRSLAGEALESHYRQILAVLGAGLGPHPGHLPQGAEQNPRPGQAGAFGGAD